MDNEREYHKIISDSKEDAIIKLIAELQECDEPERELKRPNINTFKILFRFLILIICQIILLILTIKLNIFILLLMLIIFCLSFKKTIIDLILLYQRYAPVRIRKACLFEPSCSQYMIIAIEKYAMHAIEFAPPEISEKYKQDIQGQLDYIEELRNPKNNKKSSNGFLKKIFRL